MRVFHTLATTGAALVGARVIGRDLTGRRLRAVRLPGRGLALRFSVLRRQDRARTAVVRAFLTLARSRHRDGPPPS